MSNNNIDMINHDYHDNDWLGVVINNEDPIFSGRCKIRVLGLFDNIKDEHLPWAIPINSTLFAGNGAGTISVPKIGHIVRVQFNNGDQYAPEYTSIQNLDTTLIEKIKDDYQGTHVIAYDPEEELTIIFQKTLGIQIYLKESYFLISNDRLITISTPNGESIIQMEADTINITSTNNVNISSSAKVEVTADEVIANGKNATKIGPGPYYKATLAEPMWGLLKTLATALDAKFPASPGVNAGLVESVKQSATSTTVYISK